MTPTEPSILQRLPGLHDADLLARLARPADYRPDILAAVLAECDRRGLTVPPGAREAAAQALAEARTHPPPASRRRLRQAAAGVLLLGLAAALLLALASGPGTPDPLGRGPLDTKQGLRELEVLGGKGNVLALQLRQALAVLLQGRGLALTVAGLSALLALLLHRLGREPRP